MRVVAVLVLLISAGASAQVSGHGPPPRLYPQYSLPRPPETLLLPSAARARLAALSLALADLAAEQKGRVWRASLQLGVGVGFGVAAVFVRDASLRAGFGVASALAIARGIAMFTIHAPVKEDARRFAALPLRSELDAYAKIRVGEHALAHAARKGRSARIMEGCVTMVGAAAYAPTVWLLGQSDSPPHRFGSDAYDYVGLSLAVIAFASGLVRSLVKSPAERYYEDYRALRRQAPR